MGHPPSLLVSTLERSRAWPGHRSLGPVLMDQLNLPAGPGLPSCRHSLLFSSPWTTLALPRNPSSLAP